MQAAEHMDAAEPEAGPGPASRPSPPSRFCCTPNTRHSSTQHTPAPPAPLAPQVLLLHIYETKPYELSQVLWGYGRLRIPGAPGKVFLEVATDALLSSM